MNGVIYARFSSHNQREESIEQQVAECQRLARREGITIVEIYADEALTGRSEKRRKNFLRMMRDAEKRRFEVVLAYKSARIARNMLNGLLYEARLAEYGIKTIYVLEEFADNAAGRFAFRNMLNLNQFYSENLSEDIKRGMLYNAEHCKVNGALPLGYKKGDDGRFAIDPVGAAIVHEIFEKYAAAVPLSEIAADLNARGFRSSHGKPFNKSSFQKLLRNETYLGIYKHSGIVTPGGVPRIIEDSLFQEVQKCLSTAQTHRRGEEFILTGKLFCGHCNSPMTGISGNYSKRKYYYYTCRNHKAHKCDKKNEPKDIERRVAEAIRDHVLSDEVMNTVVDLCMEYQKQSDVEAERETLRKTRDEAKRGIDNLVDAIQKGVYTDSTRDRLLELEQTLKDAESQLKALQNVTRYSREQILSALTKFKIRSVDDERYRRVLIQEFVKAVYVYDDGGLRLDCWYGDGIYLHSSNDEFAPPHIVRSNFLIFADFFSCRI